MRHGLRIAFFGSSVVSAYRNGAATYFRGIIRALHERGHRVTFYEPDAGQRHQNRDIPDPDWCNVVVYSAHTTDAVAGCIEEARGADVIIKASGVGVFDELIESAVLDLKRASNVIGFWDIDAGETLERLGRRPADRLWPLISRYDVVFTTGTERAVRGYRGLGARQCVSVPSALDPATHYPVAADARYKADLGFLMNRVPEREEKVEEMFFRAAGRLSERGLLLGGSGWEGREMPSNVRWVGHVYTRDHNAFNSTPRAILNIGRRGLGRYGFSPPARLFEAAGAGACLISDGWAGIEDYLEPGSQVLLAETGEEVAERLNHLTAEAARAIGESARRQIMAHHTYGHRAEAIEAALGAGREAVAAVASVQAPVARAPVLRGS